PPVHIPSSPNTRGSSERSAKKCVVGRAGGAVGYLVLESRASAKVEIAKDGCGRLGIGVSLVVEAEAQGQGEIATGLPGVLGKDPPSLGSSIPTPKLLLASGRAVHHAALGKGSILRQRQQVVEAEGWMGPWPFERLDVVAVPAFVADFYDVSALHVGQNVAPVIVVLDEITLSEADTVSDALSGDRDSRNGEVASLAQFSLDAVLGKNHFVQSVRIEIVGPVKLQGALPIVVGGGELGNDVRGWVGLQSAEETAVDAIVLEILVDTNEVLRTVDDVGGVESTAVCHRGGTRQVIRRRSSTGPGENRIRGTGYATDSHMSGHIGVQNLGAKRVGIVGLRPGREGRVRERHDVVSRGSRRTQSLYTEEEEELVMRNDG